MMVSLASLRDDENSVQDRFFLVPIYVFMPTCIHRHIHLHALLMVSDRVLLNLLVYLVEGLSVIRVS